VVAHIGSGTAGIAGLRGNSTGSRLPLPEFLHASLEFPLARLALGLLVSLQAHALLFLLEASQVLFLAFHLGLRGAAPIFLRPGIGSPRARGRRAPGSR
jgi:hypothetical protein